MKVLSFVIVPLEILTDTAIYDGLGVNGYQFASEITNLSLKTYTARYKKTTEINEEQIYRKLNFNIALNSVYLATPIDHKNVIRQ
jgi:hypothetical protein